MKRITNCPQTVIQEFNNNTCLFMCYIYCCGLLPDTLEGWLDYYIRALKAKCIGDDGFILDAEKLIFCLSGRKVSVTKKEIKSLSEIKEMAPVLFSINGKDGHFVVVENGQIVFNPLEVSQNVNKGKPISARIIRMV
ncbi:MAG: DUF261 family protein [Treponema sp.]|nr:DUF261 family protein [Treponema sp.]MBQ6056443.1 DUF261 family protein [Treponema sp.]MBR0487559.1 DUF261 family protein [Treponema sp.]